MYCGIKTWGRAGWTFLHCAAASYNPSSDADRTDMLRFLELYGKFLPCPTCSAHFLQQVHAMNKSVLSSRDNLLKWTVDVHNEVNKINGKSVIDAGEVPDNLNRIAYSSENKATTTVWLTSVGLGVILVSIILTVIALRRR